MESQSNGDSCGPDEVLVFVYGTMLSGEANHRFLNGARFLSSATTEVGFELVDLGGFPAMLRGGQNAVDGELYAVKRGGLIVLDELEDHPEYFRRCAVQLSDGRKVDSYLLPDAQAAPFPRIQSGSWRRRA